MNAIEWIELLTLKCVCACSFLHISEILLIGVVMIDFFLLRKVSSLSVLLVWHARTDPALCLPLFMILMMLTIIMMLMIVLDTAICIPICTALACCTHQTACTEQPHKPQNTSCNLVPCTWKPGASFGPRKLCCRKSYGVPRNSL